MAPVKRVVTWTPFKPARFAESQMPANDPVDDPTLVSPIPPGGEVTRSHGTEPSPDPASTAHDAVDDLGITQVSPTARAPFCARLIPLPTGYVLSREIARGGMGVVYAAHDPMFDRDVAVKVMHPGQDAGRFVVEAKVTARLTHPGIPPVYHLGTLRGRAPVPGDETHRGADARGRS